MQSSNKVDKNSLDQKLIDAAGQHNVQEVKILIEKGANPNYVRYTDSDAWYSGNTHTALYTAVHSNFKNETDYVNVIQYLLQKGANPNFKAVRGGWNHCTQFPLFSGVSNTICKFKETKQKIRFLQIFVKNGGNINQNQHHSRSKNWRGYNTSKCFIFDMLDACGIRSKVLQLVKLKETFNFEKEKKIKQNDLKILYQKQKQKSKNIGSEQQNRIEQEQQKIQEKKQKKQPDLQLIKAIINLGANPNSLKSQYFWQNYQNDYYQTNQDFQLSKYDTHQFNQKQAILHRCIMNNITQLVQLLIKKGAKIDTNYVFTIGKPSFPHQWPQKLKKRKISQNIKNLMNNQNQKSQLVKELQKSTDQQQKANIKRRIQYYDFQIFKNHRYNIQNQCPIRVCLKSQVSCQQLAQIFNVDQKIKQLIKNGSK